MHDQCEGTDMLLLCLCSDKVAWLSTQDKDGEQSLPGQTFRYQMLRSASVTNHIFEMLQVSSLNCYVLPLLNEVPN